jgi:hypothetical protein
VRVFSSRREFPAFDVRGWMTGQFALLFEQFMQRLRVMFQVRLLKTLCLILCTLQHEAPDQFFGYHVSIFFIYAPSSKMFQTFHGKRSYPLLWACSRTTGRKITISGITNCLNYCVIFYSTYRIHKCGRGPRGTTWRATGGDRCSKGNYLHACA